VSTPHPWLLLAPRYAWARDADVAPRATRPALQKYATVRLIDRFRADPAAGSLPFTAEDDAGGARKLFLAAHHRFYLVVCELHCDRPGLPDAGTEDVCQAGFTLRRRPSSRTLRAETAETAGVEGWSASADRDGVGTWSPIAGDAPLDGPEQVFALLPLVAAPASTGPPGPPAAGNPSTYFGLVPTPIADVEPGGAPRLDPTGRYELRCFVRRHDPGCPRRPGGRDCRGPLTWSAPSEPVAFAGLLDPIGETHRPALAGRAG
jgi:hypothetical protein